MAAQRALRLVSSEPLEPDADGVPQVRAVLELGCGCVVTRSMAADRVQTTVQGATLVVGKFPCGEHNRPS